MYSCSSESWSKSFTILSFPALFFSGIILYSHCFFGHRQDAKTEHPLGIKICFNGDQFYRPVQSIVLAFKLDQKSLTKNNEKE